MLCNRPSSTSQRKKRRVIVVCDFLLRRNKRQLLWPPWAYILEVTRAFHHSGSFAWHFNAPQSTVILPFQSYLIFLFHPLYVPTQMSFQSALSSPLSGSLWLLVSMFKMCSFPHLTSSFPALNLRSSSNVLSSRGLPPFYLSPLFFSSPMYLIAIYYNVIL